MPDHNGDVTPCPGYKRACGVTTPRPLCFFCAKSRQLNKKGN